MGMSNDTYTSSTKQDIESNISALVAIASVLVEKDEDDIDWWETVNLDGMHFDFNVFDWEEDDQPIRVVNVHPVNIDDEGYGMTDHSTWVRLLVKVSPQDLSEDEDE